MNQKLKTLLIISGSVLLISSIGLLVCVIFISKNKSNIYEINKKVKEEEGRTEQARKAASILEQSNDSMKFLKSYLVSDDGIVNVIESIEKLANDTSVNATISGLSADDSSGKMKARIDGRGGWKGVQTFLTLLETMPLKILLSNISVRRVEGSENGSPVWNFSMQIEIFKIK